MPRNKIRFPCSECNKSTDCRKDSIECSCCGLWVHAECVPLTHTDISEYGHSDDVFMCRRCVVVDGEISYEKLLAQ